MRPKPEQGMRVNYPPTSVAPINLNNEAIKAALCMRTLVYLQDSNNNHNDDDDG